MDIKVYKSKKNEKTENENSIQNLMKPMYL